MSETARTVAKAQFLESVRKPLKEDRNERADEIENIDNDLERVINDIDDFLMALHRDKEIPEEEKGAVRSMVNDARMFIVRGVSKTGKAIDYLRGSGESRRSGSAPRKVE